ncbi:MAG: UvrD-helicase domain-containing protein [Paludibacteraceae bacterium]|nr:UvrD-helicase domain-containing protein [Paludibacteraceae bacterium]
MSNSLIDIHRPLNICRASAGTGKTFTLAAYYVGLLLSGEDYRSILAITFTNKATAEMSERILGYLYGIANGGEDAFLARAKEFMIRNQESGIRIQDSDEALRQRAGECFRAMLLDYDNVQVQTIDSFLQTLLNGLAGVLNMSCGLNTELDIDPIIRQAVDQLLTTEMTDTDRQIIEEYMHFRLDTDSHWDVRQSLCAMAKELYNESVQMLDAEGRILFDAEQIARSRAAIEARLTQCRHVQQIRALLAHLESADLTPTNGKAVASAMENIRRSLNDPSSVKTEDRFRGLTDSQWESAQAGKWTKLDADTVDSIVQLTTISRQYRRIYNTAQLTIRFSRDMQLMGSLQTLIQRNLAETNSALLAQTANTLSKALKEGDADFILEKAGIRYRHILIDEFQDTSLLQWSVIDKLLRDVLAGEGHTLLIVGDIKQSIYRWRNGDWHIMAQLDKDPFYGPLLNPDFPQLTRNYRSSEQVVNFNLSLFKAIANHQPPITNLYDEGFAPEMLEQFYQADKKRGGFVRFRAFRKPAKEAIVFDMFDAMEDLLSRGATASQMMILVREKKEAAYITDLFVEQAPNYPCLSQTHIVSADSFLLDASEAVKVIIAALRFLTTSDAVEAQYIEWIVGADKKSALEDRRTELVPLPLYELVCELIKILLCDQNGQYKGSETAYVNNLLDRTRAYVSAYGSNVEEYLLYWDDVLHAKPIPASATDAIRILTVHASKGLQAQTLFVPFCNWTQEAGRHAQKIWCQRAESLDEIGVTNDYIPIPDGSEMAASAYENEYAEEHANMRIDNLNMLYVALTRAEDNLYISADFPVTSKGTLGACHHVGLYLLDFLGLNGKILEENLPTTADGTPYAEYITGEPVIKNHQSPIPNHQSNPFSFGGTEAKYAEVWSSSDQVRFVQSQEGALYTDYGEEAYRRVARMDEGTLCHEIFAHIRKADELEAVLDMFQSNGSIRDDAQRETLKALISSAWNGNEQMRDWFTSPWQLHLEEPIFLDHKELRPDRVMINPETNEAIVLDYKFGVWENSYIDQVKQYMSALKQMGYTRVRGYLWFARQNQLREIYG